MGLEKRQAEGLPAKLAAQSERKKYRFPWGELRQKAKKTAGSKKPAAPEELQKSRPRAKGATTVGPGTLAGLTPNCLVTIAGVNHPDPSRTRK